VQINAGSEECQSDIEQKTAGISQSLLNEAMERAAAASRSRFRRAFGAEQCPGGVVPLIKLCYLTANPAASICGTAAGTTPGTFVERISLRENNQMPV
jgi:hypothetical protein